jgi:hypothetical protein
MAMMKTMMGRGRKYFSVKNVFLVALLMFFIFLLSRYFMRGWYEGMTTSAEDTVTNDTADKKDNTDTTDKKDNKDMVGTKGTKDNKDLAGAKDKVDTKDKA